MISPKKYKHFGSVVILTKHCIALQLGAWLSVFQPVTHWDYLGKHILKKKNSILFGNAIYDGTLVPDIHWFPRFTCNSNLNTEGLLSHNVLDYDGIDSCVRAICRWDQDLGTSLSIAYSGMFGHRGTIFKPDDIRTWGSL